MPNQEARAFEKASRWGVSKKHHAAGAVSHKRKPAGFEGVELALGGQVDLKTPDDDLKRVRESAAKNGITIINVWVSGVIAKTPFNDDDPKVRAQGRGAAPRIQWRGF